MEKKSFLYRLAASIWMIGVILTFGKLTANAKGLSTHHHQHKHHRSVSTAKQEALNQDLILKAGFGNSDINLQEVRLLLNAGAQINAQDSMGRVALAEAVQNDAPRMIVLLLQRGANVNLYAKGSEGSHADQGYSSDQGAGDALDFAVRKLIADRTLFDDHLPPLLVIENRQRIASDILIIRTLKRAGAKRKHFYSRSRH